MNIQYILTLYVILLFSCCVHEAAHAWVADMCGDDTARLLGRVSLNPAVHIDPIGTVIFPLLMLATGIPYLFGWAKPVPVNPQRFHNYRHDDIMVSLAGIISNLLLGLVAAMLLRMVNVIFHLPPGHPFVFLLRYLMVINAVLASFNILPIPPLDGSHVLYHYLPMKVAWRYQMLNQYGFVLLFLFLVIANYLPFDIFGLLMAIPMHLYNLVAGPIY